VIDRTAIKRCADILRNEGCDQASYVDRVHSLVHMGDRPEHCRMPSRGRILHPTGARKYLAVQFDRRMRDMQLVGTTSLRPP
jgi:hypothetical protein